MGNIVLLDDLTINKIAAGEVVERPASVVKELVENSIDAGANNISVEIKNGGISYIRITDNGKGIAADDLEIAFERHATSKIRKAEDLDIVKSMGFRGEALASIAAIANVELSSKQIDSYIGNRIVVEAGNVLEKEEMGCPVGTTITVKNLFFNTPVRYKFLKKDYTEAGYIEDVITRLALVHPYISFKLISNGKVIVKTYGDGKIENVIFSIFGKDTANAIVNVDYEYDGIYVKGVVGKPEIARSNRSNQLFFVNKRYVKDKTLLAAAEQAFKEILPVGKYGFLVLNIELNPSKVDVNVHPAKLEVRFADESTIFKAVYHAIKEALLKSEKIEKTESQDKNINMGLAVIPEEKKFFGKLFKNKKRNEWEILEPDKKEQNKINNENKEADNKENYSSNTINEDNVEYSATYHKNNNFNNSKLNIESNVNVLDKIAMLQKQVSEDLEKNPRLVFDRNKLEEKKKRLEQLIDTRTNLSNGSIINETKNNKEEENIIKKEQTESKIVEYAEEPKEDSSDYLEDIEPKEQELPKSNIENIDNIDEEAQELPINIVNTEETEKELFKTMEDAEQNLPNDIEIIEEEPIINNQILQSKDENIDRILKEAIDRKIRTGNCIEKKEEEQEESNSIEDEKFDKMYTKVFGRKLHKNIEENSENLVNDVLTVENEDEEFKFNSYEEIKENNLSVFKDSKTSERLNYKFIGIAFSTYIIIEIKKELYIIDQNAANERIIYEKIKRNLYSDEEKDSQLLLLPDIINLNHKEIEILKDNWEIFENAGFEFDAFGENTIKLTGVPEICVDLDTKELFLEILEKINTVARTDKQGIEEKLINTIACRVAANTNMNLNDEEVNELLEKLLILPNPFTCPQGKPTAIKLNKADLEKKFSRRK